VIVMAGDGAGRDGVEDYERFLSAGNADLFEEAGVDERDAAAMCYSSGTTGQPKGVVYSHRSLALVAMNWTAADSAGVSRRDVILAVVPMFHINGWCLPFSAVHVGAKLVLPGSSLDPCSLLETIATERVTLSAGVPTVWLGVLQTLESQREAYDVSSVRALVIGGAAVPRSLLQRYDEGFGITVIQAWGMTETTSLATIGPLPPDLDNAPAETGYDWRVKQGLPMPFVEIRARGEQGLVPWDGETVGELEVRGPTVVSAYYNDSAGAGSFTEDQWFRTGDIVTITARGCVEIRDRLKDMIRSGGEWISSVPLENALMGHPAVAEAAVIAVAHSRWGERPLAVVVLKPGASATADELHRHLAPRFASWWLPNAFEFIDQIPRTSTGKFMKSALRERFRGHLEAVTNRA
jgi:fatty-acyl-CoA synthase